MHMAISSDVIRGYNDTMILYLLLDQPSYGYEISRQIKTLSHEKYIIKETTLYSAFTRMEKNGYITSFQDQNTATGKRRTYYRITGKGRAYYQEKCEEWLLTQEVVEQFIRKGETENGSCQKLSGNYVFKSSKHARSIQSQKRALADDGRQIHRVKK